ncbi:hypothetical protein ACHAP3_011152 [Botrytis cinerea]
MNDSDFMDGYRELQTQPENQQDQQREKYPSRHDRQVSQDSGIESQATSATSMSIRLSCNRCRLQKLKCTTPAGSSICERCTRAKVACLFGRRTYSKCKKQNSNDSGSSTRSARSRTPGTASQSQNCSVPEDAGAAPGLTSETTCATASSTSTHSSYPSPFPDWTLDPPIPESTILDDLTFTHYDFGDDHAFDQTPECFDRLQNNHPKAAGEEDYLLRAAANIPPPLGMTNLLSHPDGTKIQSIPIVTTPSTFFTPSSSPSSFSPTSLELTTLVYQIQSQLRELSEHSLHHSLENRTNLDDSISNILTLSQKFGFMAAQILHTTNLATDSTRGGSSTPSPSEIGTTADTPTILLVVAGYMHIMQVCALVLDHFKTYLQSIPGPNNSLSSPLALSLNLSTLPENEPALQRNELLSANAVHYLYQINTAVRMVQDSLRDIERHLGRGGVLVKDLAVGFLRSSWVGKRDKEVEDLARGIRELIKEKLQF